MRFPCLKTISACLSVLTFATNCALAHAPESNFWGERRKSAVQSQQYAFLPTPSFPNVSTYPPPAQDQTSHDGARRVGNTAFERHLQLDSRLRGKDDSDHVGFASLDLQRYGTIREITKPPSPNSKSQTIIHIQDIHLNPEAQANIGKAVSHLLQQKQVGVLALEGVFNELDLTPYHSLEDKKALGKVADYLLREKRISGAVHAALTSDFPLIAGIDDRFHYNANIDAYRASAMLAPAYKKKISEAQTTLIQKKANAFNPKLARFDALVQAYQRGEIKLGAYAAQLGKEGAAHFNLFLEAWEIESRLNFAQVEAERTHIINRLISKLSKKDNDHLLDASLAYRSGQINHTAFYQYLRDLCAHAGMRLSQYKAMDDYIRYVLLTGSIEAEKLFDEIRRLETETYRRLAKTNEEKELIAESREIYLIGKLLDFALTKEEWEEYKEMYSPPLVGGGRGRGLIGSSLKIKVNAHLSRLGNLSPFLVLPHKGEGIIDLTPFERFYREAEIRDELMVQNLLKYEVPGTAILVTGGFHFEGITNRLTQAGFTVVSFVPKITKVEFDKGAAYLSVFTQEKTPLDKLFAGEKLFVTPNPAELGFVPYGVPGYRRAVGSPQKRAAIDTPAGQLELQLNSSFDIESVKPAERPWWAGPKWKPQNFFTVVVKNPFREELKHHFMPAVLIPMMAMLAARALGISLTAQMMIGLLVGILGVYLGLDNYIKMEHPLTSHNERGRQALRSVIFGIGLFTVSVLVLSYTGFSRLTPPLYWDLIASALAVFAGFLVHGLRGVRHWLNRNVVPASAPAVDDPQTSVDYADLVAEAVDELVKEDPERFGERKDAERPRDSFKVNMLKNPFLAQDYRLFDYLEYRKANTAGRVAEQIAFLYIEGNETEFINVYPAQISNLNRPEVKGIASVHHLHRRRGNTRKQEKILKKRNKPIGDHSYDEVVFKAIKKAVTARGRVYRPFVQASATVILVEYYDAIKREDAGYYILSPVRIAGNNFEEGLLEIAAGGHVQAGLTPAQGGVAEVDEELKIPLEEESLIPLGYVNNVENAEDPTHEFVFMSFVDTRLTSQMRRGLKLPLKRVKTEAEFNAEAPDKRDEKKTKNVRAISKVVTRFNLSRTMEVARVIGVRDDIDLEGIYRKRRAEGTAGETFAWVAKKEGERDRTWLANDQIMQRLREEIRRKKEQAASGRLDTEVMRGLDTQVMEEPKGGTTGASRRGKKRTPPNMRDEDGNGDPVAQPRPTRRRWFFGLLNVGAAAVLGSLFAGDAQARQKKKKKEAPPVRELLNDHNEFPDGKKIVYRKMDVDKPGEQQLINQMLAHTHWSYVFKEKDLANGLVELRMKHFDDERTTYFVAWIKRFEIPIKGKKTRTEWRFTTRAGQRPLPSIPAYLSISVNEEEGTISVNINRSKIPAMRVLRHIGQIHLINWQTAKPTVFIEATTPERLPAPKPEQPEKKDMKKMGMRGAERPLYGVASGGLLGGWLAKRYHAWIEQAVKEGIDRLDAEDSIKVLWAPFMEVGQFFVLIVGLPVVLTFGFFGIWWALGAGLAAVAISGAVFGSKLTHPKDFFTGERTHRKERRELRARGWRDGLEFLMVFFIVGGFIQAAFNYLGFNYLWNVDLPIGFTLGLLPAAALAFFRHRWEHTVPQWIHRWNEIPLLRTAVLASFILILSWMLMRFYTLHPSFLNHTPTFMAIALVAALVIDYLIAWLSASSKEFPRVSRRWPFFIKGSGFFNIGAAWIFIKDISIQQLFSFWPIYALGFVALGLAAWAFSAPGTIGKPRKRPVKRFRLSFSHSLFVFTFAIFLIGTAILLYPAWLVLPEYPQAHAAVRWFLSSPLSWSLIPAGLLGFALYKVIRRRSEDRRFMEAYKRWEKLDRERGSVEPEVPIVIFVAMLLGFTIAQLYFRPYIGQEILAIISNPGFVIALFIIIVTWSVWLERRQEREKNRPSPGETAHRAPVIIEPEAKPTAMPTRKEIAVGQMYLDWDDDFNDVLIKADLAFDSKNYGEIPHEIKRNFDQAVRYLQEYLRAQGRENFKKRFPSRTFYRLILYEDPQSHSCMANLGNGDIEINMRTALKEDPFALAADLDHELAQNEFEGLDRYLNHYHWAATHLVYSQTKLHALQDRLRKDDRNVDFLTFLEESHTLQGEERERAIARFMLVHNMNEVLFDLRHERFEAAWGRMKILRDALLLYLPPHRLGDQVKRALNHLASIGLTGTGHHSPVNPAALPTIETTQASLITEFSLPSSVVAGEFGEVKDSHTRLVHFIHAYLSPAHAGQRPLPFQVRFFVENDGRLRVKVFGAVEVENAEPMRKRTAELVEKAEAAELERQGAAEGKRLVKMAQDKSAQYGGGTVGTLRALSRFEISGVQMIPAARIRTIGFWRNILGLPQGTQGKPNEVDVQLIMEKVLSQFDLDDEIFIRDVASSALNALGVDSAFPAPLFQGRLGLGKPSSDGAASSSGDLLKIKWLKGPIYPIETNPPRYDFDVDDQIMEILFRLDAKMLDVYLVTSHTESQAHFFAGGFVRNLIGTVPIENRDTAELVQGLIKVSKKGDHAVPPLYFGIKKRGDSYELVAVPEPEDRPREPKTGVPPGPKAAGFIAILWALIGVLPALAGDGGGAAIDYGLHLLVFLGTIGGIKSKGVLNLFQQAAISAISYLTPEKKVFPDGPMSYLTQLSDQERRMAEQIVGNLSQIPDLQAWSPDGNFDLHLFQRELEVALPSVLNGKSEGDVTRVLESVDQATFKQADSLDSDTETPDNTLRFVFLRNADEEHIQLIQNTLIEQAARNYQFGILFVASADVLSKAREAMPGMENSGNRVYALGVDEAALKSKGLPRLEVDAFGLSQAAKDRADINLLSFIGFELVALDDLDVITSGPLRDRRFLNAALRFIRGAETVRTTVLGAILKTAVRRAAGQSA